MSHAYARRAALLLSALLAACAARDDGATPSAGVTAGGEITVTEAQNGAAVQLPPGSRLLVSLPAHGTTGFAWVVVRSPKNLRLVEDDYALAAPPAQGPALAGGDGRQTLTFKATGQARGALRLVLRQPWDGGSTGETYTLRVSGGR